MRQRRHLRLKARWGFAAAGIDSPNAQLSNAAREALSDLADTGSAREREQEQKLSAARDCDALGPDGCRPPVGGRRGSETSRRVEGRSSGAGPDLASKSQALTTL